MLSQKLRNFFHHVVRTSLKDGVCNTKFGNYDKHLTLWQDLIIRKRGEVDLALAIQKTAALQGYKKFTEQEGHKIISLLFNEIDNVNSKNHKNMSEETQILKMIEFLEKESENNVIRIYALDNNEPFLYKRAFRDWKLCDFEKPKFENLNI